MNRRILYCRDTEEPENKEIHFRKRYVSSVGLLVKRVVSNIWHEGFETVVWSVFFE